MIEFILSNYKKYIYRNFSWLRGITRLRYILEDLYLSKELYYVNRIDSYRYNYDGVDLILKTKRDFIEVAIDYNIIEGYTRKRNVREHDVIIDAGAYPGEFTIYAAKKGKKVIALEPDKENAERLRENISLNGVESKVEVIEKGLWNSVQELSFASSGVTSQLEESGTRKINTTTIDEISNSVDIEDIDFVKMDIEGAEIEALKGAKKTMEKAKPHFAVASYHELNRTKTFHELEKIFRAHNYKTKTGFKNHLTTWAYEKIE